MARAATDLDDAVPSRADAPRAETLQQGLAVAATAQPGVGETEQVGDVHSTSSKRRRAARRSRRWGARFGSSTAISPWDRSCRICRTRAQGYGGRGQNTSTPDPNAPA